LRRHPGTERGEASAGSLCRSGESVVPLQCIVPKRCRECCPPLIKDGISRSNPTTSYWCITPTTLPIIVIRQYVFKTLSKLGILLILMNSISTCKTIQIMLWNVAQIFPKRHTPVRRLRNIHETGGGIIFGH